VKPVDFVIIYLTAVIQCVTHGASVLMAESEYRVDLRSSKAVSKAVSSNRRCSKRRAINCDIIIAVIFLKNHAQVSAMQVMQQLIKGFKLFLLLEHFEVLFVSRGLSHEGQPSISLEGFEKFLYVNIVPCFLKIEIKKHPSKIRGCREIIL
jgi:hypothetical protein